MPIITYLEPSSRLLESPRQIGCGGTHLPFLGQRLPGVAY